MMKGKIIFELTNIGTKSEFELPFLVLEDGKKVKIGFQGDNPFEQPTLHLYDQKNVVVEGEFNENGKFIATAIEEVVSEAEPVCDTQVCLTEEFCEQTTCCCEEEACCDNENCAEVKICESEENRGN